MLKSLIAERYAKALLRAAQAEGALEAVGQQAQALQGALGHAQGVSEFLADPLSDSTAKLQALAASFPDGPHPLLRSFLAAVLEQKREAFLPGILQAFEGLVDEAQGRLRASWGSPRPLAPAQRKLLEAELGRRLGRQVQLEPYQDASLLGGSVLRVGDTVYDASLRSQLKRLGQALVQAPAPAKAPSRPASAGTSGQAKPAAKKKPKAVAKKAPAKKSKPAAKAAAKKSKPAAKGSKAQPKKASAAGQALADKLFKK